MANRRRTGEEKSRALDRVKGQEKGEENQKARREGEEVEEVGDETTRKERLDRREEGSEREKGGR